MKRVLTAFIAPNRSKPTILLRSKVILVRCSVKYNGTKQRRHMTIKANRLKRCRYLSQLKRVRSNLPIIHDTSNRIVSSRKHTIRVLGAKTENTRPTRDRLDTQATTSLTSPLIERRPTSPPSQIKLTRDCLDIDIPKSDGIIKAARACEDSLNRMIRAARQICERFPPPLDCGRDCRPAFELLE